MLNTMNYSLPAAIRSDVDRAVNEWRAENKTARIWARDASVWTGQDEAKWLGWLTIVDEELAEREKYRAFEKDTADFEAVLLMGMGGSSLCPEVLAMTFGKEHFRILDSTVPAQVKAVEDSLDIEKTLFIVASKSGSTLEPNCFKQYFFEALASRVGRENAGKQFIAITDPGSQMEQVARDDGFRHIFYGKPEIGGRFSALSAFGMTAASSMGVNVSTFLERSALMVEACRNGDPEANPGTLLGLILGISHRHGRDKLTIITSPEIRDLGAWLEQLVAESTGKNGVAIIPVDREPDEAVFGNDRVFAFVGMEDVLEENFQEVVDAGHPAIKIELSSIADLGQEFFRWEFATAVAGSVIGINPFDQPDVEAAKIEARKLTDEYEETGKLPEEKPFFSGSGFSFFSDDAYASQLISDRGAADLLRSHVAQIRPGDYFALLAYVAMNDETEPLLQTMRQIVLERSGVATCLGFGPRFLHSTGQAYKGGGNNGVFLQITSDDAFDLPVPGQKYTFGVVKGAQARGDFQVLLDRGRRALRIHLGTDVVAGLTRLTSII